MLSNMTFLTIFCGFWSVAVNIMNKLQILLIIFAVLLSQLCNVSPCDKTYLTVALHMGVISDPTVDNATISPVLNNIVPNGSMTL